MPISRDSEFIFIHVPKCAGTSINFALQSAGAKLDLHGQASRAQREKFGEVWLQHLPAAVIAKNFPYEWKMFYKFTFVRNPWDWLVSLYHYRLRLGREGHLPSHFSSSPSRDEMKAFKAWVELLCRQRPGMKRGASYYLTDSAGVIGVDFVGRFETLERDFNSVCSRLNIRATLPLKNCSQHLDYRLYYDDYLIKLVAETYKDDVSMFSYNF